VVIAPSARLLVFGTSVGDPAEDEAREPEAVDFPRFYAELAPVVHRFLADMLRDRALAADATQETFVRAFRGMNERPPNVRLAAWVFGIARNVSLEVRRSRARTVPDNGDNGDTSSHERSPEARLIDREALAIVTRALDRLPDERRAALLLRLDHGLTYDEIARTMGWTLSKTKIEIHRAREVLRATYDEYRGGST
jgi:RNA polymerase sigma-70 factor (ECF subfamily)